MQNIDAVIVHCLINWSMININNLYVDEVFCIKHIRYEHGSTVKNRYSAAMYWKINFNKIEQGFISIMSDLVVRKAYKAMSFWNDNE